MKIEKIKWFLRQLLPLTYRSRYTSNNEPHFCVWKMWLGKCYQVEDYVIQTN